MKVKSEANRLLQTKRSPRIDVDRKSFLEKRVFFKRLATHKCLRLDSKVGLESLFDADTVSELRLQGRASLVTSLVRASASRGKEAPRPPV